MSGIYIHIPFCKKACYYCNFHFSTSQKFIEPYVYALLKEIELKKNILPSDIFETIYFGGGTPSQLPVRFLNLIVEALYKHYQIASNIEFTIEANPDNLNIDNLKAYHNLGVNRLSIGIQSFNSEDLIYLNRTHNADMAQAAIKIAQDKGFSNINIDLIYGIPTLTTKSWKKNLNLFLKLNIPHLSSYCLTVEPKTPLDVLINKHKLNPVIETESIKHYKLLIKSMKNNDFLHYEISNFCKENYYSKHNLSYWQQKSYLGFGASAHSFFGNTRCWNIANTSNYIKNINENLIFSESETCDNKTKYNEYILTSLRTMWGCDLVYLKNNFGPSYLAYATKMLAQYMLNHSAVIKKNTILLTDKGKLFADKIASDLFMVD